MPGVSPSPEAAPATAPFAWWLDPALVGEETPERAKSGAPIPGEHWPPLESIEYISKLIVLIILLMALPWIVGRLMTDPGEVSRHAAGAALGAAGAKA